MGKSFLTFLCPKKNKNMKIKFTLLSLLIITTHIYSQETIEESEAYRLRNQGVINNSQTLVGAANFEQSSYGASTRFVNPPTRVEGSIYFYDKWSNYAIVETKDRKRFAVNNINLNLRRNRFISKIGQDSLFIFNMEKVNKIIIDGKSFKRIDSEVGGRIFELLFESDDVSILKFHKVKLIESSANPMVNRKTDRFVKKESLFAYQDGKVFDFKLRKKDVLKLITSNETEESKLIEYYTKNKLSYKSIKDLRQVLSSINTIL